MQTKIKNLLSIKFVKDSGLTIVANFLVGISGLFVNTIVGNHYGVANLGVMNQALSLYMVLALAANFGVQTSAQKYTAQFASDAKKINVIFTNAIIATVLSSFFIVIIFLFLIDLFPKTFDSQTLSDYVKVLLFAVPLLAVNKTINNFMTGIREMRVYSFVRIVRWVTIIVLILIAQLMEKPLIDLCYTFILAEAIVLGYLLFKARMFIGAIRPFWVYSHLAFGSKSILSEFVATFNTRMPILIIGYVLGDEAAGYYSYVEIFAFSILMVSAAVQQNFSPVFTRLWHENEYDEIVSKVREIFKISFLILLPGIVGISLFFYTYTSVMMPSEYLTYLPLLLFLLLGVSLTFLFGPFFTFLILTNHLYSNLLRALIYASLNIALTFVFVDIFGLFGVPLAYLIAFAINIFILNVMYINLLDLNLYKILTKKL